MIAEFEQENSLDPVFPEVAGETAPPPAVPKNETAIAKPASAPIPGGELPFLDNLREMLEPRQDRSMSAWEETEEEEHDSMEFVLMTVSWFRRQLSLAPKGVRKQEAGNCLPGLHPDWVSRKSWLFPGLRFCPRGPGKKYRRLLRRGEDAATLQSPRLPPLRPSDATARRWRTKLYTRAENRENAYPAVVS